MKRQAASKILIQSTHCCFNHLALIFLLRLTGDTAIWSTILLEKINLGPLQGARSKFDTFAERSFNFHLTRDGETRERMNWNPVRSLRRIKRHGAVIFSLSPMKQGENKELQYYSFTSQIQLISPSGRNTRFIGLKKSCHDCKKRHSFSPSSARDFRRHCDTYQFMQGELL